MTTLPSRRTQSTVVERIKRFVGMGTILDYSIGFSAPSAAFLRVLCALGIGILLRQSQNLKAQRAQRIPAEDAERIHPPPRLLFSIGIKCFAWIDANLPSSLVSL